MDIKGVIFDLDGLLVNTERVCYLSWKKALNLFNVEFSEAEYSSYAGNTVQAIAEELVRRHALSTTPDTLREIRKSYVQELLYEPVQPMPYAKEAIQYFVSLGIPLSVGTGSSKETAVCKLEKAKLLIHFNTAMVTGDDVDHGKPAPDIYLKAASILHAHPNECLVFEDSSPGVQAAKLAGAVCYAIPGRYTQGQDFSNADRIFPGLEEAIRHLEGCMPHEPLPRSRWSSSL